MNRYTIVAGSFTVLHRGHKNLLRTAAMSGNPVIIGLTTDSYIRANKSYRGRSFGSRERAISRYLSSLGADFQIRPLEEKMGNSTSSEEYDSIVVSPETDPVAQKINRERVKSGLSPLSIIRVPYTLAQDLFPINSARILAGEITPSGRRKKPIRVGICTRNFLKVSAAEKVMKGVMHNVSIENLEDYDLPTEQPLGSDTVSLAIKRAQVSLGDRDYGLGVESGLYREPVTSKILDFHACAIIDRYSRTTLGFSSGFEIPDWISDGIRSGETESEAFRRVIGDDPVITNEGIVGFLSGSSLKRSGLIGESIRNALIPRTSQYFVGNFTQND